MRRFLRIYSTLFVLMACLSASQSASAAGRGSSSGAWLLATRSKPGTILFNGQWYLPNDLSAVLAGGAPHTRNMFATCGGTVGGTDLDDDFDGDGVCNVNDIDDDNDGVVDALESAGCFYTAAEAGTIAVVKTPLTNDDGTNVDLPFMHDGVTTTVAASNNVIAINQAINGATVYAMDYNTPVRLTSVSVYGTTWGTGATAMLQGSNDNTTWADLMSAATAATANPKTFTVNNNAATAYRYYRLVKAAGTSTPAITSYEVSAVHNTTGYNASAHPKPTCVADLDSDSFANHQDADSDGDGCSDSYEAGAITTEVANHQFSGADANEDGLVDSVDGVTIDGSTEYAYLPYAYNANQNLCTDTDGDGVKDLVDIDDDNDGILDSVECPAAFTSLLGTSGGFTTDPPASNWYYSNSSSNYDVAGNFPFGYGSTQTNSTNTGGLFDELNGNNANTGTKNALMELNGATDALVSRLNQPLVAGVTYRFSFDAGLRGGGGVAGQNCRLWLYNADANSVQSTLASVPLTSLPAFPNYQTIAGSFTVPTTGNYYLLFMNAGDGGAGNDYNVDRVALIGDVANPNICDVDGDGVPNHLDLDSDGDNCPDAVEAGVSANGGASGSMSASGGSVYSGGVPSGTANAYVGNGSPDQYGTNGFFNGVETGPESGAYNSSYNYIYALNSGTNLCSDADGDGVGDFVDIDDDNDGILDAVESPDCYYSQAEASSITVTSELTQYSIYAITNSYDGNTGTQSGFVTGQDWVGKSVFEITPGTAVAVSAVNFDIGSWYLSAGSAASTFKLQGWTGTAWEDLSAPMSNYNSTVDFSISNTMHPSTAYSKYRITGVAGTAYYSGVNEITLTLNAYVPSAHPKLTCTNDTDGDGILNHLDLDSDGDGCPDAVEAGVSGNSGASGSMSASGGSVYTGGIPSGTVNAYLGNGTPEQYGANGFFNGVETNAESGAYNANYTYIFALNNTINACPDSDGDGVSDLVDIDDDNDGVPDAVESPACYYTAAEWNTSGKPAIGVTVSSSLTTTTGNFGQLTDGVGNVTAVTFSNSPAQPIQNKNVYLYTFTYPVRLDALYLKFNTATQFGGTTKIQGSNTNNGSDWVDLSAAIAQTAATNTTASGSVSVTTSIKYPVTSNAATAYKYIRITGVAATDIAAQNASEVYFDFNASSYVASLYPKSSCNNDTDGDGVANHLDLDSDGDGCSDALESGATAIATANYQFPDVDTNGDGLVDAVDNDGNGIVNYASTYDPYAVLASVNACSDTDGDGVKDVADIDDDNDGVLDVIEAGCNQSAGYNTTAESGIDNIFTQYGVTSGTLYNQLADDIGLIFSETQAFASGIVLSSAACSAPALQGTSYNTDIWIKSVNPANITQSVPLHSISLKNDCIVGATAPEYLTYSAYGINGNLLYTYDITADPSIVQASNYRFNLVMNPAYQVYAIKITRNSNAAVVVGATLGSGNGFQLCDMSLDTDGDGIPNYLDLDSDGDGCPDAVEAGVSTNSGASGAMSPSGAVYSGGIASGTANAYVGDGTPSQYGANGFFNGIETSSESGVYNGNYTYITYALGSNLNLCADTDSDGLSDIVDLDDDNDGILDAVESPSCYYTSAEAGVISSVSTALANDDRTNVDLPFMHDGVSTSVAASNNVITAGEAVNGAVIYSFEFPAAIRLTSVTVAGSGTWGTSATAMLQGSNDKTAWDDLMAAATAATANSKTFTVNHATNAARNYQFYRIVKIAGTSTPAITTYEVSATQNTTGYVPSAHPKGTCTADADGDGIVNHHDLDSDGDGCPDATEGGGGFTTGDLEESTLAGGNSGAGYTGAVSFGVDDNLGNTVDANGVPTIANGGQALGQSQTAGTPCPENEPCALTIGGAVYEDRDGTANGVTGTVYTRSQLYVALVSGGAVQSVAAVGADGTYSFTGVVSGTYELVLTTSSAGSLTPILPGGVVSVAEGGAVDAGSGHSLGDGNPNAMTSVTMACPDGNAHVDFGIDSSLPVTLISLTASQVAEGTLLQWLTADEKDFDRFEIEQSAIPQAGFKKIGEVKGGGSKYAFTDAVNRIGASYYRLKMVDTDGTFSYSRIVTVTKWNGKDLNRIYPNPAVDGSISINSLAPIESYQIYDANGKAVEVRMSAENGAYKFTFGKSVASGVYVIRYRAGGQTLSQQFVLVR